MGNTLRIGIIGEFNPARPSQVATGAALKSTARALGVNVEVTWMPTLPMAASVGAALALFDGLWAAPGDPYQSSMGALNAIRYARENEIPFLGTCMGFQHAALEFARNVLGIADAAHAEIEPGAANRFIDYLPCSVRGQTMLVELLPDSKVREYYGAPQAMEQYYCSMGLNRENQVRLKAGGFQIGGVDQDGEARILELPEHPFYVATLFVPQRNLLDTGTHPLITAYLRVALGATGA